MSIDHTIASRSLIDRIQRLHASGRTFEEVAVEILNGDPETTLFRVATLIRIIIDYARSDGESKDLICSTLSRAASSGAVCGRESNRA